MAQAITKEVTTNVQSAGVGQLPFLIENIQDGTEAKDYINILIYGAYGVGKTTLAGSAVLVPEMKDVLLIDSESGKKSIEHLVEIDKITINTFSQLEIVKNYLKSHCAARDAGDLGKLRELEGRMKGGKVIREPKQYQTVIVDSLSEITTLCHYKLAGIRIGITPFDQEPAKSTFDDWTNRTSMITQMIRTFRDLPLNVIFTCAEKLPKDDATGPGKKIGLYLQPKELAWSVPGQFDAVGYYVTANVGDKKERRLYLQDNPNYVAKNRWNGFEDEYVKNPTMSTIYEIHTSHERKQ